MLREGAELTDDVVAEIKESVKERKGAVQSPKQIIATDALPLTGLGKPDKKALRAQYWGDQAAQHRRRGGGEGEEGEGRGGEGGGKRGGRGRRGRRGWGEGSEGREGGAREAGR